MLKEVLLEYCNESSIHGMRYITDKRKTLLERCCWMLFLIFSIACCLWFTANLYISAQRSSIIMTISNRPIRISDILFPSMTICPTVPINVSVYDVRSRRAVGLSNEEESVILQKNCGFEDFPVHEPYSFDYVRTLMKANLRKTVITHCIPGILNTRCNYLVQEIPTNNGLCFTYNSIRNKDLFWSNNGMTYNYPEELISIVDDSYRPHNFVGPYEYGKVFFNIFTTIEQSENTCIADDNGFIVSFRSPYDIVVTNSADIRIKEKFMTVIALTPKVLQSSEELKSFKVAERECYFDDERRLYFIRHYTQENCHFECLTNITLKECRCVQFYMPRLKLTPVCFSNKCSDEIEADYDNMGIGPCQCYPMCNSVTFDIDVTAYDLNAYRFLGNVNRVDTRLSAFSKSKNIYPFQRSQLYGFNDYVASFGGLLGLFLGVSILSIIELFYYILMRPLCLFLKKNKKSKIIDVSEDSNNIKDLKRKSPLFQKKFINSDAPNIILISKKH